MAENSKPNPIPFSMKLAIVAMIMASTLGYSILKKRQIDELTDSENSLILKNIPSFRVKTLEGNYLTENNLFSDGSRAALVHFWGTWCGPCEAELPEFIQFVKNNKSKGVKALLLAVQDDEVKIKKFLKKLGTLPDNIVVAHDKEGGSMITFGTVKVPETYLFAANGKNLNKFIGPQTWSLNAIQNRLEFYLSSIEGVKNHKIESH
jgi:cytochrome c biogenesis protein CcmG, thiol:disulfide interchange protein DsbE